MNFKFGVFLIQALAWLVLLVAGFGFANEHFGVSEWEFMAALACLLGSAYLVDENLAKAFLPIGQWEDSRQKSDRT